ncbi:TCR gamma alternate reading frame protein isoform X2 [Apteryx rowi]|uniref:TCR gamma alternate reading frame protein isoform X2 n=1 Tax=Apteryx rowi TaxID=308060 RepID=UPI000E1C8921|nr:TCR gamma alternate reading frame protein isoform X2 [Apteryx rowi]
MFLLRWQQAGALRMLLLPVLALASAWSHGEAQVLLKQHQTSVTQGKTKTARIDCIAEGISNFQAAYIHWYRHIPSKGPEWLLYIKSAEEVGYDQDSYKSKYSAAKKGKNVCTLSVNDINPNDEGTYCCAYWEGSSFKVFGSGTKLIVSDKGTSAPKSYEVLSSENENKLTYVCLVEKFYPEVIRVTWTEGGDEVIDNVVNGEVWKSDDDQYSIGSWLTVPKENKNKKYLCKYEHESNEQSFAPPSTQDLTKTAEKQDCNATSGNSRIFYGDHLMHRTAYLVYIVLLLKSSMYYVIVLFFVYRMRTPAKHHGKKT